MGNDELVISLREALGRFGGGGNTYDWHRRSAQQSGSITLGGIRVAVTKVGGRWLVGEEEVEDALKRSHVRQAEIAQATDAYGAHEVRGVDGDLVKLRWGGYRIAGAFHFVWNDMRVALHESDGSWRCNTCWEFTDSEHEREECHRCRDWSSCGSDCTLSAVRCATCGTRMEM